MRRTQSERRDQLLIEVRKRLGEAGTRFKFEIVEAGVRKDDDGWYVPVVATSSDGRQLPREFTNNLYANIEEQIASELKLNLLFIPALP